MGGRKTIKDLIQTAHSSIRFFARHIEFFLISALIVVAAVQYSIRPQSQSLAEVRESGVLRVLISDEPDSQYIFGKQHYGFEYELLAKFAESIGAELELEVVPFGQLFTLLDSGAGDLAVGGIVLTPFVENVAQPTIPWYQARTTVVYKRGTERPFKIEDIEGQEVQTSARYFGLDKYPNVTLVDDHRSEYQLLSAVANGAERFVLSTSYRAKNAKHYLPDLNRGFLLPDPVDIVWALPKRFDLELQQALNEFLEASLKDDLPNKLAESYLALPNRLSTFDALYLQKKIAEELPKYEFAFRKAARRGGVDWQLLAALSYQESRWSNEARSPTGVRGIMQLTVKTAKFLGVDDRMDMTQSIDAAGDYLYFLKSKFPERIKEPELTWFAVGAYNMGRKHILYAYRKARELGLDRTKWSVVSELLPNLYGVPFSQGRQAKSYVERIQVFTDILRFYDLHQRPSINLSPTLAVAQTQDAAEKID